MIRDGRYELERPLGHGGAATVWLARDTLLQREVAVKVLNEGLVADREWIARFNREARVAAALQHPNLVAIYDFDADGPQPYLVMAYIEGGSLRDRLTAGDVPDVERLAGDMLRALAHIHAAGIIHRDVKPGNVLLADDGRACLADFGVARIEDATAITQVGQIPGTQRYMAPELWRGEPADERSDLYACGVVLTECLGSDSSRRVAVLAERLRAEDRALRPASAEQALRELDEPLPPRTVMPDEAPTRVVRAAPPSRFPALAALGAVTLAVIAVLAAALSGGGDDTPRKTTAQATTTRSVATPPPAAKPAATRPAGNDGRSLNDRGYALIREGRPVEAVPLLQQAVAELRDDGGITYAFALFNLGSALRQAGRPAEAIPILEERLEFPNQTKVVAAELKLARKQAKGD